MIPGISKKLLFYSFLFINFIQPSKSLDLEESNNIKKNRTTEQSLSEIVDRNILFNRSNLPNINLDDIYFEKNFLNKYPEPLIAATNENQSEIIIQSDQQSEVNGVIYAEGNVLVEYRGKVFKADNLIYNKSIKTIRAKGNITVVIGEQIFKSSELEFSFLNQKGYLLDVKGSLNTSNLIDDLSSNFSFSDSKQIESSLEFKKEKVLHTPGEIENWLFLQIK